MLRSKLLPEPSPVPAMSERIEAPPVPGPDAESRAWLVGSDAKGGAPRRGLAAPARASPARGALRDQPPASEPIRMCAGGDLDDLAHQAANDALFAILGKLDTYRGESRFTTWAYKFALLEAAVRLRRRAWQGREVPIEPEHWSVMAERGESPASARGRAMSSSTRSGTRSRPSSRDISERCWSRSR